MSINRCLPPAVTDTHDGPHSIPAPVLNLLLVSRSDAWIKAVHGAASALGQSDVSTCAAQDALTRLAGSSLHYSHVLIDADHADGLCTALASLAEEAGARDTDMLLLGGVSRHPFMRVISTATAQSVQEALTARSPRRVRPVMELSELRAALNAAMIETRYQPIIRVADRRPVGLEALVRLNHPDKGTLLPDLFVPQLEDAGLAAELTRLVSARAFSDLSGPLLARLGLRMSVNFPLDVMLTPQALQLLEKQRAAAGVAASRIVIELTESQPVDDLPTLRRSLEYLRNLGYGVAIDDVGPAVPRLEPLLELPFTSLKLDKAVVQSVANSDDVKRFLSDTIAGAKARRLTVVAEGVETETIWDQIASFGVDEVQGFLAARPLPVAAVPIWWAAWSERGHAGA